MPILLAFLLGLIQALTEFLPVSSSGHLVLGQLYLGRLFDAERTPLVFDVLVHFATFSATLIFLRDDLRDILQRAFTRSGEEFRRLIALLVLATIPAVVVGLGFQEEIESFFSSIEVVRLGFLATTAFLVAAHLRMRRGLEASPGPLGWELPTLGAALLGGCAQAFAIVPGISRSGATICTALLFGLSANAAIRFSFLLSLPVIFGAMVLKLGDLTTLPSSEIPAYSVGFVTALVAGYFAIRLLVMMTKQARLIYFAAYTALLSLLI